MDELKDVVALLKLHGFDPADIDTIKDGFITGSGVLCEHDAVHGRCPVLPKHSFHKMNPQVIPCCT